VWQRYSDRENVDPNVRRYRIILLILMPCIYANKMYYINASAALHLVLLSAQTHSTPTLRESSCVLRIYTSNRRQYALRPPFHHGNDMFKKIYEFQAITVMIILLYPMTSKGW